MGGLRLKISCCCLVFLASCLSLPRSFHALRYKDQKVFIDQNHYYQVGALSQDWKKSREKTPGIVFKHSKYSAKIATEALCGAAFEDVSLPALTKNLLTGLEDVQKLKQEEWSLSQRKALYSKVRASLDGVPVALNIVVIKKDQCQFDFLSTAPLEAEQEIASDFVSFVRGFDYR